MTNPWLEIPLADYEGHMALPEVAQATLFADLFERILCGYAPESVAILGCAGGNGFNHIDPKVTQRVVGIDVNPAYIAVARERYHQRLPGLELIVADLQQDEVNCAPVDLAFAALLFEYADADAVLKSVCGLLKRDLRTMKRLLHGWSTSVRLLRRSIAIPAVEMNPAARSQQRPACCRSETRAFI